MKPIGYEFKFINIFSDRSVIGIELLGEFSYSWLKSLLNYGLQKLIEKNLIVQVERNLWGGGDLSLETIQTITDGSRHGEKEYFLPLPFFKSSL